MQTRISNRPTDDRNAGRDLRWPRLFAGFLWNFGFFSLGSLIGELAWDAWKYGLGALSAYQVLAWLCKALGFGLFCSLFIAFSTWLAQELFGQSRKDSPQRPGA